MLTIVFLEVILESTLFNCILDDNMFFGHTCALHFDISNHEAYVILLKKEAMWCLVGWGGGAKQLSGPIRIKFGNEGEGGMDN